MSINKKFTFVRERNSFKTMEICSQIWYNMGYSHGLRVLGGLLVLSKIYILFLEVLTNGKEVLLSLFRG